MNLENAIAGYLPMSETMYYILLSLTERRHGYGIMQHVEGLTNGRIRLGAGTIYNSLSRLEKDSLINAMEENDRRKFYLITGTGLKVLQTEIKRLKELYENGKHCGEAE